MSAAYVHAGGAGHVAAMAAIANAIKATGAIIRLAPEEFAKIMGKIEEPVVVHAMGGFFSKNYQYMISYKGFFFFTQAKEPLQLPYKAELITAKSIWMPQ